MTIDSSGGILPFWMSFLVTATSVPPAGSVNIPSVWAKRMDTFKNFFVGYTFAPSARFPYGLKDIVAISRISNSDGARDCVWFHGIDLVRFLLKSVDNWGTAGSLSRINLVAGIFDQTDFDQFLESPLRASVESFHPGIDDNVSGKLPTERLCPRSHGSWHLRNN